MENHRYTLQKDFISRIYRRITNKKRGCRKPLIVLPTGFEPMTYGLEGRCSIQLSYEGINRLQKYKNPRKHKQVYSVYVTKVLNIWQT